MAKNDNLGDFLTDIANAIREKKGTSGSINAQNFASEIASISTGGSENPEPDIPIIGDGKTYLYIKIEEVGRMTVPLCFSQTISNGVTIDWGDGSVTETLSGTGTKRPTHKYVDVGEYVISLNPQSGCKLGLGGESSGYSIMGSASAIGRVYCNMLKSVEIGKNVTTIDVYAFYYCFSLSSIIISDSVTSIGNNAFDYCHSLSKIIIPDSVTSIGNYAFSRCFSLSKITIPDSVTSIGTHAFNSCYILSSITIPDGVTSIGNNTFYSCYPLSSITIPDSVTSIGNNAFYNCYSLTKIIIPDSVTSIGSSAFYYCYSLSKIIIPDSVTSIGNNAFCYCYGMALYDFSRCASVPTLAGTSVFNGIQKDCKIVVPDALYDTWIAATNWSNHANNIVKQSEFNA